MSRRPLVREATRDEEEEEEDEVERRWAWGKVKRDNGPRGRGSVPRFVGRGMRRISRAWPWPPAKLAPRRRRRIDGHPARLSPPAQLVPEPEPRSWRRGSNIPQWVWTTEEACVLSGPALPLVGSIPSFSRLGVMTSWSSTKGGADKRTRVPVCHHPPQPNPSPPAPPMGCQSSTPRWRRRRGHRRCSLAPVCPGAAAVRGGRSHQDHQGNHLPAECACLACTFPPELHLDRDDGR